jgi:nucleotide-binding universal stress UspA family protein
MPTFTDPPVVVGIDGSAESWHALHWAADEAARRHCALRAVHAFETLIQLTPEPPYSLEQRREEAARLLGEARARVQERHPGLTEIDCVLDEGHASRVLLEESTHARMLVVGRRGLGRFERLVLGSTSRAVSARAHVPVVVVPRAWIPRAEGAVVLGVEWGPCSQAAAELAFEMADSYHAPLRAVTAWDVPMPAPGEAFRPELDYWREQASLVLGEGIAGWRQKFPDVCVSTDTVRGHPVDVLINKGATAHLIVVGGRSRSAVGAILPGSVADGVIRHAPCPVAVVHEPAESGR